MQRDALDILVSSNALNLLKAIIAFATVSKEALGPSDRNRDTGKIKTAENFFHDFTTLKCESPLMTGMDVVDGTQAEMLHDVPRLFGLTIIRGVDH